MFRGTLQMRFEYSEENFDGDLSDEQIKDMVQDNVLANPGRVHSSIEVVRDPGPEDGLSQNVLGKLNEMEAEERDLCSLDIGDVFSLEEGGEFYALVDVEMLDEYQDNVWTYVNAVTGEYEGLLRDGASPTSQHAKTVYYYNHHNALGGE